MAQPTPADMNPILENVMAAGRALEAFDALPTELRRALELLHWTDQLLTCWQQDNLAAQRLRS